MELQRAIEQISAIHAQVLRTEVFRGYRAVPVAMTSAVAPIVAAIHVALLTPDRVNHALLLWIGYAAVSAAICGTDLAGNCLVRGRVFRRQAILVVSQFLPALVAGAAVTAVGFVLPAARPLLPGLWIILYALGIFASLPYLPRPLRWVATYYLAAGTFLMWRGATEPAVWAEGLGVTFCVGQAAIAFILHWHLERQLDGR
ncbi:MAG: hypothetical protein AAF628_08565 [Planctomycetota bacterium]